MTHPFVQQFDSIMKDESIRSVDKMVVAVLFFRQGGKDNCWPSIPRLVKDVGADRKTIIASLKRLAAADRVSIIKKSGCENHYELNTSAENGTSPKMGTTESGTSAEINPSQKRDSTSAENGTHKRIKEKNINTEGTPSALSSVYKSREIAEKAIDALDLEYFRVFKDKKRILKYSHLNIEDEHFSFKNHHLGIQANYHGPKKKTDWGLTFHTWLNASWKKPKPGQATIDRSPEQAKKQVQDMETERQKVEAERAKEDAIWAEINKFPLDKIKALRNEALPLAQKQTPGMRPPEVVVKINMIRIYEAEKARAP